MSWRVARSLEKLRDQINDAWPGRNKASDGTLGDSAHQATQSDHNPDASGRVDAMDITHDPSSGADMGAVSEAIRGAQDYRINYIIFNRRICSSSVQPWKWRVYTGSNPHTSHLHVSVLDIGADDASPWQIGETVEPLFETKAPKIMRDLMATLEIGRDDAAAILGNLGHESDGFRAHQQYGHTGSSGGIGWAQWTGARRNDYEMWAASRGLDVRSDEANFGFLVHELTSTSESRVIPMLRAANGLREKTIVFCDTFERPGIKAHDNRVKYAQRALAAGSTIVTVPPAYPTPTLPSDGSITPDDLLSGVRPETVVVRDTITSQIEGFPRGTVETTYVRKSVRFVPDVPGHVVADVTSKLRSDPMNFILKLVADMLLKGMGPIDGFKTVVGLAIAVAAYVAQQMGYEIPVLGADITSMIGYLLAAFGLGAKGEKSA